ncbi:hypothetical protein BQ8482_110861 [Mesorhizobium delmotii]|uniref:Uncharacterized protein n=1 Tax=Mesorhizobium delmotii TaxID=1631247 RepID=A0A2P9ACT3_9HYPH|nr:hypothetical protein BQ8482_110861 [Mesorhizobium delmotii]
MVNGVLPVAARLLCAQVPKNNVI